MTEQNDSRIVRIESRNNHAAGSSSSSLLNHVSPIEGVSISFSGYETWGRGYFCMFISQKGWKDPYIRRMECLPPKFDDFKQ